MAVEATRKVGVTPIVKREENLVRASAKKNPKKKDKEEEKKELRRLDIKV